MNGTLRISLKSGERIFINGAMVRVDRRVSLELLNSVTFLLEQHVLAPDQVSTPLRRLYYTIQSAVMEPATTAAATAYARHELEVLRATASEARLKEGLERVELLIARGRLVDGLKVLRSLFPIEAAATSPSPCGTEVQGVVA